MATAHQISRRGIPQFRKKSTINPPPDKMQIRDRMQCSRIHDAKLTLSTTASGRESQLGVQHSSGCSEKYVRALVVLIMSTSVNLLEYLASADNRAA
eukprot:6213220-Pleurochrysis_carterae.AAC.10